MLSELDSEKYNILKKVAEGFPFKLNLQCSFDIKLNYNHKKNN